MTERNVPGMVMIPCKREGVCQECATKHESWEPHNLCLYYQYWFYGKHGRFPTWEDAMAHCTEDVKKATIEILKERGGVCLTELEKGDAKE